MGLMQKGLCSPVHSDYCLVFSNSQPAVKERILPFILTLIPCRILAKLAVRIYPDTFGPISFRSLISHFCLFLDFSNGKFLQKKRRPENANVKVRTRYAQFGPDSSSADLKTNSQNWTVSGMISVPMFRAGCPL